MPRPLLARLKPDSIAEFRAAAFERFYDGEAAAANGRRTAAIYLWGYTAEMTVKAAYFRVVGFSERQRILFQDLKAAVGFGQSINIFWPSRGQLHSVRAWGETLVGHRQQIAGMLYSDLTFEQEVLAKCREFERIWSETLRYHPNIAYPTEYRRIRLATDWLLIHSHLL